MITLKSFTFNPFSENSYILSDETGECVIIDPGCYTSEEEQELAEYIALNSLKPVKLLNTHCHVDHVFGNLFVAEKWKLGLEMHKLDVPVLESFAKVCQMYGFPGGPQPEPAHFFEDGDPIKFGNSTLDILFTPGHSPGSVCFYSQPDKLVIGGDVLFQGSIGRTDLPGGNFETLEHSIRTKLYTLPDDVEIYPGHGPATTVGAEKRSNPFVSG
ncbi:MAG TPA: MBL fold metallo-hydrolase [Bacteroidia bacterium]|nr:MBL fold metallo-hydrolase [Bacteroidia bacterium]